MTEAVQQVEKLVTELQTGFNSLKQANEQYQKDTDVLVKQKMERIAEDTAKSFEDMQGKLAKFEAALNRPGAGTEEAADADAAAHKKAFENLMRRGEKGLTDADSALLTKAMSTDDNANGGYLVPTGTMGMINGRIFETSPMRRLADVRTSSFKTMMIDLDDQEADARWEGEGSSSGETNTPGTGKLEITAKKMEAEPKVSVEELQDAYLDVEKWLSDKVSDKFSRLENTSFITGDGVLKPRGILTYTAGTEGADYVRGSIEQVVNGSTSAPTESGLIRLIGSLKEEYQANANLIMKRASLVAIMLLAGSTNFRFLNLQPTGPAQSTGKVLGPQMMILDRPVTLFNDMPTIGSNALSIGYGDFQKGYQILDRVGISVLRDPYTSKGNVKFFTTKRTGGAVKNFEAIKLLKFA